jgi:hypothetical protein
MSRGDRVPVSQNLSLSMRQNYDEYGVDEVRRPFLEGIHVLILILSTTRKWVPHTGIRIILVFGHVYLHGSTSNVDCPRS